jgi:cell division protein FtsN
MVLMAGCGSDVSTSSKAVSQLLEHPESAKYTNVRVTPQGNVCGQVKSKDASGNFGGFQSYVALKTADGFKAILDKDGNNAEVQAACGPSLPPAPAVAAGASAGWEVQIVQGSNMGALSDMTSRLVEHGFMASIAQRDGVTQVYLGPFADKAEADAKRAELMASQGIESVVVAHQATAAQ